MSKRFNYQPLNPGKSYSVSNCYIYNWCEFLVDIETMRITNLDCMRLQCISNFGLKHHKIEGGDFPKERFL